MQLSRSARGWVRGTVLAVMSLLTASAFTEHFLEKRDAARLTAADTFLAVRGRRVRYRLTGTEKPGPTVVLICGVAASLEQWDMVQTALSTSQPVISYDRAGMGFSDPSDRHDATAQAEELDGILHAPGISPPFVLVSYSGSAMLARVFAAQHRDVVAGLVFLDPTVADAIRSMPDSGRYSYRRRFGRAMAQTMIKALFGVMRIREALANRHKVLSPLDEKSSATRASFHHWLATTLDIFDLDRSDKEADQTPWFGTLPLGVLSTLDPDESEMDRRLVAAYRNLATKSTRGIFRAGAYFVHDKVLEDAATCRGVADLVQTITNEAREGAAVSP